MGKDGLYNLAYVAYQEYRNEVIEKGTLYRRYVENFLNGHTYSMCLCFRGKNEHRKNLGIIKGILELCAAKVNEEWNKEYFSKEDFIAIKRLYDTTEKIPSNTYPKTFSSNGIAQITFECYLTIEQMDLIAECANEAHLFYGRVSKEDMYALLVLVAFPDGDILVRHARILIRPVVNQRMEARLQLNVPRRIIHQLGL